MDSFTVTPVIFGFGILLTVLFYITYRAHFSGDSKRPTETPAEIRGIADDNLKFIPTTNLIMVALARTMEAQGVEDEPLIQELYKRGRSSTPK